MPRSLFAFLTTGSDATGRGTTRAILERDLLRIDGLGGLLVGAAVVGLHPWLASWYGLPGGLLLFSGAANLLYGTYATVLARRRVRPLGMVTLLAMFNMGWAPICGFMLVRWGPDATALGFAHFALEGLYVGGLGALEWRWRARLAGPADGAS